MNKALECRWHKKIVHKFEWLYQCLNSWDIHETPESQNRKGSVQKWEVKVQRTNNLESSCGRSTSWIGSSISCIGQEITSPIVRKRLQNTIMEIPQVMMREYIYEIPMNRLKHYSMVFTWDLSFLFLSKSPRELSWSMIYVSSFLFFSFVSRKRSINLIFPFSIDSFGIEITK